ncbi:MAG TPA: DNA alkylation repair protein [Anaerolineae bacterium]|nr:DNA alkylation repair protein [Anaerolineae bacterium]
MTAIDPQRLAREIDALGDELEDAKALRSRVVALLDIYADRTRHTGASGDPERTPWTFDVPAPVLRTLRQFLTEQLQGRPQLVWSIAEEFWHAGYRETQILAADLASLSEDEGVGDWAEARAHESLDSVTLITLAGTGLEGWRRADPQGFLGKVLLWLKEGNARIKTLGVHALTAAVQEASFEDLPTVYRMIHSLEQPKRGELKRAVVLLLRALARRSPAETTHFLLDRIQRGGEEDRRLAQQVEEVLPVAQRATIQDTLSGS